MMIDIMAISESRLTKDKLSPTDTNLTNSIEEFCPTEANAGGTLIYIRITWHKKLKISKISIDPLNQNLHLLNLAVLQKTNIIIVCILSTSKNEH